MSNENESTATCIKCSEVFTDESNKLMICERCENRFCTNCLQMNDSVYSVMVDRKDLHWFCEECEKPAITAVRTDMEIEERCAAYMSIMTHRLDNIEGHLATKADAKSVKELETRVRSLEEFRSDASTNAGAQVVEPRPSVSVSDTIAEQKERKYRASNIIIHNIPEPSSDEAEDRIKEDLSAVMKVFEAMDIEEQEVVKKCVRLGKKEQGKNRPTKIILNDKGLRSRILKRAKVLKDVADVERVYVGPDLTKMQRTEQKELRKELLARREKGETDIFIRRGKIVQAKDRAKEE